MVRCCAIHVLSCLHSNMFPCLTARSRLQTQASNKKMSHWVFVYFGAIKQMEPCTVASPYVQEPSGGLASARGQSSHVSPLSRSESQVLLWNGTKRSPRTIYYYVMQAGLPKALSCTGLRVTPLRNDKNWLNMTSLTGRGSISPHSTWTYPRPESGAIFGKLHNSPCKRKLQHSR